MAAAKTASAKKTTAKKTTAKKTATAKKPAAKKTEAKKTTSKKTTARKTTGSSVKVTATEKKLLELYREADSDTKKAAMALLKGEKNQLGDLLKSILGNKTVMNTVSSLLSGKEK